jgi:hypothetical protein
MEIKMDGDTKEIISCLIEKEPFQQNLKNNMVN